MAVLAGGHQRGVAMASLQVDVSIVLEEQFHDLGAAPLTRPVEHRGLAQWFHTIWAGSMFQQTHHDLQELREREGGRR